MSKNMQAKTNRDIAITILHVIGMVMILLCHIFQEEKNYLLGELFIIGVPLFLFVAGFLCGSRPAVDVKAWLLRKCERILLPAVLYFVVVYTSYGFTGVEDVSLFQWVFSLLNLQGLNYTYWKFDLYGAAAGCGHLWFVTTIMFCYLLTPLVQRIPHIRMSVWQKTLLILAILAAQAGLLYLGFQLSYLLTYFFGYFAAKKPVRTDGKWYSFVTVLMGAAVAIRLLARRYMDATILYDRYIALISGAVISAWIFYTVYFLKARLPRLFACMDCRLLGWVEGLSYYVYITHYLFLRGYYSVWHLTDNKVLGYILFIAFTTVSAALLHLLTEKVVLRLFRGVKK